MNQKSPQFKRLLLTCALGLAAVCACAAQQTPAAKSDSTQKADAEKAAATTPATDKENPAVSALDEELAKTPAGKTVAKFFTALNSGDLKQMRAFHEGYG